MGECADDILKTLQIVEDKASYEEVKSVLENHFSDRRNVLVERARFNRRVQRPGEPVDTFIQDLYKIAADCENGTLKNELIRDRIIVGVVDDSLSDRLQSKPKLTLQEAVQIARQAEERKYNRDVVRGDATKSSDVYYVANGAQTKGRYHKQNPRSQETKGPHTPPKKSGDKCNWCGHERHDRKVCPARSVTCNKCKKKGHYQAVCQSKPSFSKSVNEVKSLWEDQVLFLGEINGESNDSWTAQIGVNGHNTKFKLETGASVCVLSDSVPWLEGITLEKPQ